MDYKTYSKCWKDFNRRLTSSTAFAEYLNAHPLLNPVQTALFIGPGDCKAEGMILKGEIGATLKRLWMVEPNEELNEIGLNTASSLRPNLEIYNHNLKIQDYEHKGPKLDLILSIHSLYYFNQDLVEILEKMKQWIRDAGTVLFVIDDGTYRKQFREALDDYERRKKRDGEEMKRDEKDEKRMKDL